MTEQLQLDFDRPALTERACELYADALARRARREAARHRNSQRKAELQRQRVATRTHPDVVSLTAAREMRNARIREQDMRERRFAMLCAGEADRFA